MLRSHILAAALVLAASASLAQGQTVIVIPMDAQINLGMGGTNDSPSGDAIYVPPFDTRDYLSFESDAGGGFTRLWIQGNDPNGAGGYYYGPYIDFSLAGYGPLDFRGIDSTLEFDVRYNQDPFSNGNPYFDAPIFARVYTYDEPNDVYLGRLDYGMVYQTGPGNQCTVKPTGYPEWWHITIPTSDLTSDLWNCDGAADAGVADDFDLAHVSRMRFWGTDWNAAALGPANDWIDVKNVTLTLFAAPCDYDLTGDGATDLADLSFLLAYFGCSPTATVAYDTGGFESYTLGNLPGQDGWIDDTTDGAYGQVQVISDPTGSGHGQIIAIDPPGIAGGWLGAYRAITPPTKRYVIIEWDQYRTDSTDNFWYADTLDFGGWWAMQWDQNGQASSYFFEFGVPITPGQWQHVKYVIDTVAGRATVDIDGVQFASNQPDTSIDGIALEVEPTEAGGENGPVYMDNLTFKESDIDPIGGCPADLNGDLKTDLADLSLLLTNFGCTPG